MTPYSCHAQSAAVSRGTPYDATLPRSAQFALGKARLAFGGLSALTRHRRDTGWSRAVRSVIMPLPDSPDRNVRINHRHPAPHASRLCGSYPLSSIPGHFCDARPVRGIDTGRAFASIELSSHAPPYEIPERGGLALPRLEPSPFPGAAARSRRATVRQSVGREATRNWHTPRRFERTQRPAASSQHTARPGTMPTLLAFATAARRRRPSIVEDPPLPCGTRRSATSAASISACVRSIVRKHQRDGLANFSARRGLTGP